MMDGNIFREEYQPSLFCLNVRMLIIVLMVMNCFLNIPPCNRVLLAVADVIRASNGVSKGS